jgi:protein-L-isoaspartate(D-aspartate) O-methyltransferase
MDRPPSDAIDRYAAARALMVDGQVRPNKVNDPRIIEAMRRLPRERFLPPRLWPLAYSDENVPLGNGRVMIEPMVIARLVQLAAVRSGERALVVGAGTGYGAALLAACGAAVTALEEDEALLAIAREALAGLSGVSLVAGGLAEGYQQGAPYDLVLIEGAVDAVPPAIAAQLRKPSGRLVTARAAAGTRFGQAVLAEPTPSGLSLQPAFDCTVPVLPQLRRAPAFVF